MSLNHRSNLEVADIFRNYGHLLSPQSRDANKVISDIKNCRTEILGGHKLQCDQCDFNKHAYNSCRNRHCPKCQFMARVTWIEKRMEDLLPCQYFHVVFTIPAKLRRLFLQNKKDSYNILFKASSQTLKEVAENPKNLGAKIGFIGVLHTWSQSLIDHPHIHFIVPGGGLNEKNEWIECKKDYFLPVRVLSKVFRAKVLQFIEEAYGVGQFNFYGEEKQYTNPAIFKGLLQSCTDKDWAVYAKEPFAGPEQVINYLGGYTHRIAISNYRLIKVENGRIHFKVRDPNNPGKKKLMSVTTLEFMRRFLLHVLPKRFVRIRHFGILGTRLKKEKIEFIRKIKGITVHIQEVLDKGWEIVLGVAKDFCSGICPKCRDGTLVKMSPFEGMLNTS
jgi:hypothetical protein